MKQSKAALAGPVQVLLDGTRVYYIDASEKKHILTYTDPDKKLKPKLYTRAEFAYQGGIVSLYSPDNLYHKPFAKIK